MFDSVAVERAALDAADVWVMKSHGGRGARMAMKPGYVVGYTHALAAARVREAEPEHAEVAAERERQVTKGYGAEHDDRHGAYALARMAQGYVLRGLDQGNRSDFIKAAGLLEAAAASFRRLGHPLGTNTEE